MLQSLRPSYFILFALLLLFSTGLLSSCKDKVICPAYQSAFLHDPMAQQRLFYPFDEDTLPVDYSASVEKTRYGIMKLEPYKKKVRELRTVEMEYVYPPSTPDSARVELLAYHELDSAQRDSIEAGIQARKNRDLFMYNRDMKIYMEEIGQYQIVDKTNEEAELDEFADELRDDAVEEPEKEKKGFFRRIFGGKKKKKEEEVILEEDSKDPYELDYYQEDPEEEEEEKDPTTKKEIGRPVPGKL